MVRRASFEHGLTELRDQIMSMGEMVSRALHQAVESLRLNQVVLAQHVIQNDARINRLRFAIEEQALTLIATQGPVAHDLRLIAAVLNIVSELERMGDHAKGIAIVQQTLKNEAGVELPVDFFTMAEKCRAMLDSALQAFFKLDASRAREIAQQDDELDELYNKVYLDLLGQMTQDSSNVNRCTHLLWVAHNLERFADRIVNICERVIFVATGEMVEINTSRNG